MLGLTNSNFPLSLWCWGHYLGWRWQCDGWGDIEGYYCIVLRDSFQGRFVQEISQVFWSPIPADKFLFVEMVRIVLSCKRQVVKRKIFFSSSALPECSGGFIKVSLALFLARAAASCIRVRGYFHQRKSDASWMMCWSKSTLLVQICLTLRN